MTSVLIAALIVALIAIGAARRLVEADGGSRSQPMPRAAERWHPHLPSHPYATGP